MKRIIAVILIVLMLFCTFSCAPSKKSQFKDVAAQYFAEFSDFREGVKCSESVKFTKNGAYAVQRPETKTAADTEIEAFYNGEIDSFKSAMQSGDTLFISYRAYAATEGLGSIEVFCQKTLSGVPTESKRVFHYNKDGQNPINDELRRAALVIAKAQHILGGGDDSEAELLKFDNSALLFKNGGLEVGSQTVPYASIKNYLPESVVEVIATDTKRVIDPSKKLVAITYDDGPCKYTNDLLDIFKQYNSVATFFEAGQLLYSQPEALQRMDSEGHELASHTWSHKDLAKCSDAEIKNQLDKTDNKLVEIVGKKATLMRPPYGSVSKRARAACDKPMIGWSVDTLDWQSRNADKVIAKVKNEDDLEGDVILMHSLYPSTVEATRVIVPWLIENGYQLVTGSELFAYKYQESPKAGTYYASNYFGK